MIFHYYGICDGAASPRWTSRRQNCRLAEKAILPALLINMLVLSLSGCGRFTLDIETARARNAVVAEYEIPKHSFLEEYELVNCWVEEEDKTKKSLMQINLRGPHVDTEPRIYVHGPRFPSYKYTASDEYGLIRVCYRINSVPNEVTLSRGGMVLELKRRFSLDSNHAQ